MTVTFIIDVAIPNTHNLKKSLEKTRKLQVLNIEMIRICGLTKVHIVPLAMSTTGILSSGFLNSLQFLELDINIVNTHREP